MKIVGQQLPAWDFAFRFAMAVALFFLMFLATWNRLSIWELARHRNYIDQLRNLRDARLRIVESKVGIQALPEPEAP